MMYYLSKSSVCCVSLLYLDRMLVHHRDIPRNDFVEFPKWFAVIAYLLINAPEGEKRGVKGLF